MNLNRKTVWKYPLPKRANVVDLPPDAQVVHVGHQGKTVMIWVEAHRSNLGDVVPRRFMVYVTGDSIPPNATHLGTTITEHNGEVLHVYEEISQ